MKYIIFIKEYVSGDTDILIVAIGNNKQYYADWWGTFYIFTLDSNYLDSSL